MIMSLVVIAVIAALAYLWATRGVFGAFLHTVCTVLAGALAFAFFEPIAGLILENAPNGGFFGFIRGSAFGIALGGTFAISLALLRLSTDALIPGNLTTDGVTQFVGGGLCGAVSGVITAGVLVLTFGFMHFSSNFLGYQAVQDDSGNPVKIQKLIVPADTIVVGLYDRLSETSLRTGTPLSAWRPDLAAEASTYRMSFGEGDGTVAASTKDVAVLERFRVDAEGVPVADLVKDTWNTTPKTVLDLNNKPPPAGSRIEGFVIQFDAGAKESFGQVVIGNGQVRLVAHDRDGESLAIHPYSVITQSDGSSPVYALFRFEGKDFIGAASAATQVKMGFQFIVPPGYEPVALHVKGARHVVEDMEPAKTYASTAQRDSAIANGSLMGGAGRPLNDDDLDPDAGGGDSNAVADATDGLIFGTSLGRRMVIQKGGEGGLRYEGSEITSGTSKFDPEYFSARRIIDPSLRIDSFYAAPGITIARVDAATVGSRSSLLGKVADRALQLVPPTLVDTNGARYEAVGYIYKDRSIVEIRFTPDRPLRGLTEVPETLSQSRSDQELQLVFQVSTGVRIDKFLLGTKVIVDYENDPAAGGQ